jgi:hypothetical protein
MVSDGTELRAAVLLDPEATFLDDYNSENEMFASTRPLASRARRRSPLRTKLQLKAKPCPAGTIPTPASCPR